MPKKVVKKTVTSSGAGASSGSKSLFTKSPRNFRIGGNIQPTRDLTRFVRWAKYIRIQRQKRIMFMRLKAPPALSQFRNTIDKNQTASLLKLLAKYSPETHKEKKTRLQSEAEARKGGNKADHIGPKPNHLKFGLNHVTTLVEEGKAKLVVMAADVDPLEIMVFLPALCRKKGISYAFVKSKARLGKLVHAKTATCVALTDVRKEDLADFSTLQSTFKANFNDNIQHRRHWAGGVMGIKNQHMMAKREKLREIELAKKANM
jgi:large subunit ribosomal protein L7Ae